MRALILSLALILSFALPAKAQDAEIQGTISAQIEAFKVDDFDTAFGFAHANIRRIFQTPQNFGRMVSQGYPMVWRPAEVTYKDLRERSGSLFQDVQVVDAQGRVFLLEYAMTQTPEGWKISGVRILEQTELST